MDPLKLLGTTTTACHAVAMPYPGRGHVNPMMNLCKLLCSRKPDLLISFVVTEEWRGFLEADDDARPPNLRLRTIPNVIPSEHGRAKDFPGFLRAVCTKMEGPFERLMDEVETPVSVIIADTYLGWISRVGNRRNIPVASLWTNSATVFSVFYHFDLIVKKGHFPADISERGEEKLDYIPGIPSTRLADLPTIFHGTGLEIYQIAVECVSLVSKARHLLFTSFYEFEDQVIEALRPQFPFPIYTLGPSIPHFQLKPNSSVDFDDKDYFKWLDYQPQGSVLYVSMGSFLSVSSTQMEEIITGIHDSGVRFLWVSRDETNLLKSGGGVRGGDYHKTDTTTKNGFYGEKGMVVPWCDQLRVLCHPSVGGFWSHCGWNSTLEAVYAGVPVLASPIVWDQIPNTKKIVDDWKIGWRVKKEVGEEHMVTRQEISELVKSFMDQENKEVKDMRERARKLQGICKAAIAKGGSSDTNLDSFITDISLGLV